ncbi:lysine--tRNA ligase [Denitrobaculum tricleocarpae]|uniref:Lysine--tRNA ligase n=1 Tax=Denitrobaculum tricleocarpae TaxID=2591009 RepID=A0A545T7V9_9PROT|nr:lysine--tRNA ligase [Denitrobaculum tricleocarpae]TQV73309.1 lysine--tRNA ligase [Denitrobaculum tricleocarpae]
MSSERELALQAKAWPFDEARNLLARIGGKTPEKGYVLFETGYGPSGLPHIGTFGEVVRTSMVRRAFQEISDIPTKLYCFSDDMDGLRKVPDNVPNKEMLEANLGRALTSIPDPFGEYESFGHHNNARLRGFLDSFGFDYEFQSSTELYKSGRFDDALRKILHQYDDIQKIMLPSLGPERRETYSPFMPVCPKTGQVLQVPILERHANQGTVVYRDTDGELVEVPVTGGQCKLQWKPDWAMRWYALDVDYEMSGKDLMDSVKLGARITKALGGKPPGGFTYELFLDEKGEKISKSKGNGLSVEEWLQYAPQESLALFMYQKPKTAKRLYFDAIPRMVDDYLTFAGKLPDEEPARKLENPAWHIHGGQVPSADSPLSFGILLNLAGVCNTEDRSVLWGFVGRYVPEASPEKTPFLDSMIGYAIRYYQDFVKPSKSYRAPDEKERAAMEDLLAKLKALPAETPAEDIQTQVYEVGKTHSFENLRDWFKALYEVLLGQSQGPRLGSFFALYGLEESCRLVQRALDGEDLA